MYFKNEICAGIDCLLAIDWSLILKKTTEEIKFCRLNISDYMYILIMQKIRSESASNPLTLIKNISMEQ